MTWEYDVKTAQFYHNGTYVFSARYAGADGYYNDPSKECVMGKGPLPRGTYHIGAPFFHPHAKKYTMRLTPSSSNNMCGRDGFLIHGDSISKPGHASNGCIILDLNYRIKIGTSHDHVLIVK
ncbi:DUF2778 domain-containing protein [Escherichia sp. ESNIH1]|uniref:tlde1 domain-containing protein n=1 Tax=Escherichia sp. ESNIH1 TaxID=1985876 RepID=UPI000CDD20B5|nr:tlde1 domain-containing protein [Escherichia sp. ESNIH1]POU00322.1 DUF2778 domain-containing protein [Escherichia sp. ESNIH1]